jgi:hypothetical protein
MTKRRRRGRRACPDPGRRPAGQRADLHAAIERALARHEVQHEGAEAAHGALFDGDQHFVLAREARIRSVVERLGEARVGDGGGEPRRRACRRP